MQSRTLDGDRRIRAGMVGLGMIFDETYRPLFEGLHEEGLFGREFGLVEVPLVAVATRTGARAERYARSGAGRVGQFASFAGSDAVDRLLASGVDAVCVATPDDRHFDVARRVLAAAHPSGTRLEWLDPVTASST